MLHVLDNVHVQNAMQWLKVLARGDHDYISYVNTNLSILIINYHRTTTNVICINWNIQN